MINILKQMEHMNISTTSPSRAIQSVRDRVARAVQAGNPETTAASKFIMDLVGVEVTFTSANRARLTALAIAEEAVNKQGVIADADEFIKVCTERADKFVSDPNNQWMFAATDEAEPRKSAVVDGISTAVAVHPDGKIKRGGRQILVNELYTKHVLEAETPLTQPEFVNLLMKEMHMTKAGARTFGHNAKKALSPKTES
jgi:hypothetical protein